MPMILPAIHRAADRHSRGSPFRPEGAAITWEGMEAMRSQTAFVLCFVLCQCSQVLGQDWTVLDVQGAAETHFRGVSGGNIVGYYLSADYSQSLGFLYDGSSLTAVGFPGSEWSTLPTAIDGKNIVGSYAGGHGFLYDQTTWTTLDCPWADAGTLPSGVSGGRIVGSYYRAGDDASAEHLRGFLYDGTSWTAIDRPGAADTMIWGISGNKIVGAYTDDAGVDHGFVYDAGAGTWADLAPAGAVLSYVTGMSAGNTVGIFDLQDADGLYYSQGFLYDGATWATLDVPLDGVTWPYAIDGNTVVGDYVDSAGVHGFIVTGIPAAVPEPAVWAMLALGGLGILPKRIVRTRI